MKTAFYTLGCRLNQTESAIMAKSLEDHGHQITEELDKADLCVINSCAVTNQSVAKCRQKIRSLKKQNPQALIAVAGCLSQIDGRQILETGKVDLILGNQNKLNLWRYIPQLKKTAEPIVDIEPISSQSFTIDTLGQRLNSTRANLKIQDGCDFNCSFCVIPVTRGKPRSRKPENIRREAQRLAEAGVKEISLTGVNIGVYQQNSADLTQLLEIFEEIDGIQRIRLSSIEFRAIDPALLCLMKKGRSKLVPYLHLPLQSADNKILKLMNRKYSFEQFQDFVLRAVEEVPEICVGSDIIAGFPGETEQIFEESYQRLLEIPIHYFHVFPYSERKQTLSSQLNGKMSQEIKSRRAALLRELGKDKRESFVRRFHQKKLEVLFENNKGGDQWQGYSQNYIRVKVNSRQSLRNQIRSVKILSSRAGLADGVVIEP